MTKLKDKLKLKAKDIVSIVGAGGKTTSLYKLGRELSQEGKVLITTSTKIGVPKKLLPGQVYFDNIQDYKKAEPKENIVIMGQGSKGAKIQSITDDWLEDVRDDFDFILIEADGARGKAIKAWREHEPVILEASNKTLGILPIYLLNKKLTEKEIFAYDLFVRNFSYKGTVNQDLILEMIKSPKGFFKNTLGEKHLYINHVGREGSKKAEGLIRFLKEKEPGVNYFYGDNFLK